MRTLFSSSAKQSGFTLIEIMIAMAISVILLNGILQIFQSSKQSYRTADGIGRMQENARYALNELARDIRQAGFLPCRKTTKVANVLSDTTNGYDFFGSPLQGFEGNSSLFPNEFNPVGTVAPGTRLFASDGIRILRGGSDVYSVESHNPTSAQFKLNKAHTLDPGDILLVCDAENASIFQVSNANQANVTIVHNTGSGSPGNCTKGLGFPVSCTANGNPHTYGAGSQVVSFESLIYYIGPSLSNNEPGRTAPPTNSLYRRQQINSGGNIQFDAPQELVEGIETMQLVYGEALDITDPLLTAAVRYVAANDVTNWNNVVSVRVGLLLHTPEEISTAADSTTYNVVGTIVTDTSVVAYPSDRRQRYVFSETIRIRNRGEGLI